MTASLPLYERAKKERKIPVTSRGGAIILSDLIINKRQENILVESIDEIVNIALKYQIAISLGTTFRPAGIDEACDSVHIQETKEQIRLCHYLQKRGVNVIVENIGHIDLNSLEKHLQLLLDFKAPIMPLGPLPTDNAIGCDHIASAIGTSFLAYHKSAHIINSITPSEHSSSKITLADTLLGIRAVKLTAHCINLLNFNKYREIDSNIFHDRAKYKSCLLNEKGVL
ncbi:MAG: phosphomethylpyrimidine synthase ThiC [Prevotella sp.]|nr:phosphomethylpyrimidine synthase ThiC [Prevotella sp.]